MESLFFHVDMDAFYASVEQNDHPELKGKPVIIGATSPRAVVSTCSYEARKFGVHSAMRGYEAKRLCPQGIFLPPNMDRYERMSIQIMNLLKEFAPHVHQISIDEAFLDMSGTSLLFPNPLVAGKQVKDLVKEQTGLTISVGIAPNPYLAKMASDYQKPDGLYQIKQEAAIKFIDQFPLSKLWGVGSKSTELLNKYNLHTPAQIRQSSPEKLRPLLGNAFSDFLYKASFGKDPGIIQTEIKNRSVSNEQTFMIDLSDREIINAKLLSLSHQVVFRLLNEHLAGKTYFIKIRYSNFETISAQRTLPNIIQTGEELYQLAQHLFNEKWDHQSPIRLLGVGISNVQPYNKIYEPELFYDENQEKKIAVEKTILNLMKKGVNLKKASLIEPNTSNKHMEEK